MPVEADSSLHGLDCCCHSKTTDVTLNIHILRELQWAALVARRSTIPLPVRETRVRSLGGKDPLEKGMATHSIILAWEISWTDEPGGLQSTGCQRVRRELVTARQQVNCSTKALI